LHEGGLLLGAFPDSQYTSGRVTLTGGDILVAQTDGIPDACDSNGERFSFERVMRAAARLAKQSASDIAETLFREAVEFGRGGAELHDDDKVLLVMKFL
jgi:serine phosphatase RsbU (regulator of sigma subunit)